MIIFRNKKDKQLYVIYRVSPRGWLGSWHTAVPYNRQGKVLKHIKLDDFVAVAHSGKIPE